MRLLLLLLCILSIGATWQQSQDGTIELGVRDKFGELKNYDAEFIVKGNGKKYQIIKHIKGDEFGTVYFPKDFKTTGIPGKYTWKCTVNNKEVASGDFKI